MNCRRSDWQTLRSSSRVAASIATGFRLLILICVSGVCSIAATLPAGFSETQITNGLTAPTAMEMAPDGRIFVCLQGGSLRVIKNGSLLATPFLTLTVDANGERGLLGVAFDPNFTTNHFVYVYYTVPGNPAHNRVSRFTANGDVAAAGSELAIVDLDNLSSATNHNGGAIHFGPDGKLYIAVGENANPANSQTLNNRLGKILRINPDGSIPADNPFFNNAAGANRSIWGLGLRNPFTFGFQPGTGRLLINDVGQNTWEEINDGIAGSNYGWSLCEGACSPPNPNFRDPLFQYGHGSTSTTGCAIVGAAFYDPTTAQFPQSYVGKYFFADLCTGWIRLFDPATKQASDFASGISNPVDLKVSNDGSLYYLSAGSAALFRVFVPAFPAITNQPADQTVPEGQSASFSVTVTGNVPFSYQWQRNQVNISGATSSSYTLPSVTFADNGARFRCVVTNALGSVNSNEAILIVNAPPSITGQPSNQTVNQGQPATFEVVASGSQTLTYQWQRNQVNIAGATSATYTLATTVAADNGVKFRCVVTNPFGTANSNEATLTVMPPPPQLATEDGSDSAIALNAANLVRDPFPLIDPFNFSSDSRTRVILFATGLPLAPGEGAESITARSEDAQFNIYPMTVEYAGAVPGFSWLTEIVLVLPSTLPTNQSVLISVTWHTQTTNKARIRIK